MPSAVYKECEEQTYKQCQQQTWQQDIAKDIVLSVQGDRIHLCNIVCFLYAALVCGYQNIAAKLFRCKADAAFTLLGGNLIDILPIHIIYMIAFVFAVLRLFDREDSLLLQLQGGEIIRSFNREGFFNSGSVCPGYFFCKCLLLLIYGILYLEDNRFWQEGIVSVPWISRIPADHGCHP